MRCDDGAHVSHATVANFYSAPVEYFMVSMVLGEVFAYQLQELLANIGGNVLVEWWVKPDDITGPLSLSSSCSGGGCHDGAVPTLLQGFHIHRHDPDKLFMVAG